MNHNNHKEAPELKTEITDGSACRLHHTTLWLLPLEKIRKLIIPAFMLGLVWGWLENLVLSAVKIIPLGQTAGQRILRDLADVASHAVQRGLTLPDDDMGASAPALAVASSRHETQYTRLFRS